MSEKLVQQGKMDYETAKLRLESHANLPDTGLPIESNFVGVLWLVNKGAAKLSFADHVADILACLQVVNRETNKAINHLAVHTGSLPIHERRNFDVRRKQSPCPSHTRRSGCQVEYGQS